MEIFVHPDCSDTWFPFTQACLPNGLQQHAAQFLEAQKLVCNIKALNLERGGAHWHFPLMGNISLKRIEELGKGGSGYVERVISTITHMEYALELIRRGQTFRKDKAVLRNYERELTSLKKECRMRIDISSSLSKVTRTRSMSESYFLLPTAIWESLWSEMQERKSALRYGHILAA
jgi:hypothetical protein